MNVFFYAIPELYSQGNNKNIIYSVYYLGYVICISMQYTILYSKISYNISLVNNPFNKSAEYSILSQNLVSTAQRTDKILSAQLALYLLCSVILYQRRLAPAPGLGGVHRRRAQRALRPP